MNLGNGMPRREPQARGGNSFIANLIPREFEVSIDNSSLVTLAVIIFGAVVASKLT